MQNLQDIQNTLQNTNNIQTSIELAKGGNAYLNLNFLQISTTKFDGDSERTMYYNDDTKFWAAVKRYIKKQ
jgi:hypothetical protein